MLARLIDLLTQKWSKWVRRYSLAPAQRCTLTCMVVHSRSVLATLIEMPNGEMIVVGTLLGVLLMLGGAIWLVDCCAIEGRWL